jgi:hypothetical protein
VEARDEASRTRYPNERPDRKEDTVAEPSATRRQHSPPAPGPETRRLGALVGRWRSEGHVVEDPPVPIRGTDVYEWVPGGFFLVHHVKAVDELLSEPKEDR